MVPPSLSGLELRARNKLLALPRVVPQTKTKQHRTELDTTQKWDHREFIFYLIFIKFFLLITVHSNFIHCVISGRISSFLPDLSLLIPFTVADVAVSWVTHIPRCSLRVVDLVWCTHTWLLCSLRCVPLKLRFFSMCLLEVALSWGSQVIVVFTQCVHTVYARITILGCGGAHPHVYGVVRAGLWQLRWQIAELATGRIVLGTCGWHWGFQLVII